MIFGLWSQHFARWMVTQVGGIWTTDTKSVAKAQLLCEQMGFVDKKAAAGRENQNRIAQHNAARAQQSGLALPPGGFSVPGQDGRPVQMAQKPISGDGPPLIQVIDPRWIVAEIGRDGLPKGQKKRAEQTEKESA